MKSISMIFRGIFLLLFLVVNVASMARTITPDGTFVKPTDKKIQYVGRISFKNPLAPCFTYPGVQINARFEGTSLKMVAKPMSGYFMAQIDGCKPFKVGFNSPNDSIVTLAVALPDEAHEVRLTYVVEGFRRHPEFWGFILDNGRNLLNPPFLPKRKIEFIGDSMTCGLGIESMNEKDPYLAETENYYYSYAARTAQALDAQALVVACSGIGVYRNHGGPKSGSNDNMSVVYNQTLWGDNTETWNFLRYIPDVVCVNLGMNDVGNGEYDRNFLLNAYRNFYKQIRTNYPRAKVVFISGSMLVGTRLEHLQYAMDEVVRDARISGDKNVFRFDMSWQTGDLGMGACGHPSMWQHEKMAGELTAYLRGLMEWF
ncbi:MAG: lipase [Bacteroidaceae bacterium]|nr:lipase [Bacteroidaceae bacterium]